MRKRNFKFYIDKVIWAVIVLLPLILYAINLLSYRLTSASETLPSLYQYLVDFGCTSETNIVYTAITSIFGNGSDSILSLFGSNSPMLVYFTYFISVEILHLFVDFICFIPRLSHKWLSSLWGQNE